MIMSLQPNFSGKYSTKPDEIIISEGDRTSSVILLLEGKVDVYLSDESANLQCRLFNLDNNTFLSVNDIMINGKNSYTLKSRGSSSLFCFGANSPEDINNLLSTQKDYSSYIISSLASLIDLSFTSYQKLLNIGADLSNLTKLLSVYYWAIKDKFYFPYISDLDIITKNKATYNEMVKAGQSLFPIDFDNQIKLSGDSLESPVLSDDLYDIEYFTKLLNISSQNRKAFFNSDSFVCEYHMKKASEILLSMVNTEKAVLNDIFSNITNLYLSPNSLLSGFKEIILQISSDKEAAIIVTNLLEYAATNLAANIEKLQNEFDCLSSLSPGDLNTYIDQIKAKINYHDLVKKSSELPETITDELRNSLETILNYCEYDSTKSEDFLKKMAIFRAQRDKASTDSEIRSLRASITNDFFEIYELAIKKTIQTKDCPRIISMFINFGYMDEKLLTPQQTMFLYRICDKDYSLSKYNIYSTKNWLENIYDMKKDPSINEFDQDYFDVFREMKKRKIVTDNDKQAYDEDVNGRLNFEINNMIRVNQKICHGHMSSYFPVLYKDIISRDLEKAIVTPQKVADAMDKILNIDYSAFHRELWYKNEQLNIEKQPIMKEILPDIILIPTFGPRASMWQEIAGKARNTPGRFILPTFTDENVDDIILKLIAGFRWELCRTMMGAQWNDVTEKSLTSEYTDYIQFYKKNKDLSDDMKEKIKVQVTKCRNVTRDVFVTDYETWINFESKGILRLNRIVRGILFRYCPFSKEIREPLAKQPAFSELAIQFLTLNRKTARTLESKFSKLLATEKDAEIENTIIFYRDM
jgi:hypothetical protein